MKFTSGCRFTLCVRACILGAAWLGSKACVPCQLLLSPSAPCTSLHPRDQVRSAARGFRTFRGRAGSCGAFRLLTKAVGTQSMRRVPLPRARTRILAHRGRMPPLSLRCDAHAPGDLGTTWASSDAASCRCVSFRSQWLRKMEPLKPQLQAVPSQGRGVRGSTQSSR